jgi:hypothetical protein
MTISCSDKAVCSLCNWCTESNRILQTLDTCCSVTRNACCCRPLEGVVTAGLQISGYQCFCRGNTQDFWLHCPDALMLQGIGSTGCPASDLSPNQAQESETDNISSSCNSRQDRCCCCCLCRCCGHQPIHATAVLTTKQESLRLTAQPCTNCPPGTPRRLPTPRTSLTNLQPNLNLIYNLTHT